MRKHHNFGIIWSFDEIQKLKNDYPKINSLSEIKELFPNRTLSSVRNKANEIGLNLDYMNKIEFAALDCKNRNEFFKKHRSYYDFCNKNNLLDKFFPNPQYNGRKNSRK